MAASDATIGDYHANRDLMPGGGAISRLFRRIGTQTALELIYTGRTMNGTEAKDAGLVLRCAPPERLEEEVNQLIAQCLEKSRHLPRQIKRVALTVRDMRLECALEAEHAAQLDYFRDFRDAQSGIR